MQKLTSSERAASITADIVSTVIIFLLFLFKGLSAALFGAAIIFGIFLFFAVPFERGRIRKNSWMYKFLTSDEKYVKPDTLNLCSLPGRIMGGIINCCIGGILKFIGNLLGFLFFKKIDTDSSELFVDYSENHIITIKGHRIWPISIFVFLIALWQLPAAISFWLNPDSFNIAMTALNNIAHVIFIGVLAGVLGYGLSFPLKDILKSIWNITKALFRAICIIRNIPEAA